MMHSMKSKIPWIAIFAFLLLGGCAKPQPEHVENICSIFKQYPEWYWNAKQVEAKWGIPVPTLMSIINQESAFNAHAKPPRKKVLWVIPGKRISTSYGYTQALTSTWKDYQKQTGSYGKRQDFNDACNFIGWYSQQAKQKLRGSSADIYALYLAYHDGMGGYGKYSYLKKPWLIRVAHKVKIRAALYKQQLASCEANIPR
jgi:hypothetical protein